MVGCLAARTANHRSNEPPPCFAWGDPYVIAPVRTLFPRGWADLRGADCGGGVGRYYGVDASGEEAHPRGG